MKSATSIIALLFISTVSFSQSINTSTINSCGGNAKNGYYQFEWSVGESTLIDQMESAGKLLVTNGFLQPYLVNPGTNDPNYLFSADEINAAIKGRPSLVLPYSWSFTLPGAAVAIL